MVMVGDNLAGEECLGVERYEYTRDGQSLVPM